ncbi:hypothetical protein [Bacteroides sp.]|uniref:hypothetical protein n=1 Tax=Bacteroides sp. TaxID=29523 RepID=UPI00260C3D16|nr:hypothetical protein [Bacteroides sp.]MDD3039133.1 hypothetical protein [Bacteroides sp.]
MDKYYNIAGFLICVTGEKAEAIQRVCSFEPFEVKPGKPYFTFYLTHKTNKELLVEEESALHYRIDFENIVGHFVRLQNDIYQLTIMSPEDDKPLFLNYRLGCRECILGGLMKPDLLQFALWAAFGMLIAGQAIVIYASVIVFDNKAIVFLADSDTVKSTHTHLWLKHIPGSTLLTDNGFIILRDSSTPYICGSPWSKNTPCFQNKCIPLAGIVHLSQASHNQMYRLWMLEAVSAILPSCPSVFAEDKELSRHTCDTISEVLNFVPVWQLECLPDEEAVRLLYTTVFPKI